MYVLYVKRITSKVTHVARQGIPSGIPWSVHIFEHTPCQTETQPRTVLALVVVVARANISNPRTSIPLILSTVLIIIVSSIALSSFQVYLDPNHNANVQTSPSLMSRAWPKEQQNKRSRTYGLMCRRWCSVNVESYECRLCFSAFIRV